MGLFKKISHLFRNKNTQDLTNNLEDILLESGLAPKLCAQALTLLEKNTKKTDNIQKILSDLCKILSPWTQEYTFDYNNNNFDATQPKVCFFIGVNGVGKTTSIAKFAFHLINKHSITNSSITLAAGDTFRAAAALQLENHAQRLKTDFIRQKDGTDPAAVIFDAVSHAKNLGHSFVLADTAGRMNTRTDLIAQLKKIYRITERIVTPKNIISFIILDGNNGLASINQVRDFMEATALQACIFTKYDGSTRGGSIISVSKEYDVPCAFLGTGETYSDLKVFNKDDFFYDFLLSE